VGFGPSVCSILWAHSGTVLWAQYVKALDVFQSPMTFGRDEVIKET
jgi:hypothetical protein